MSQDSKTHAERAVAKTPETAEEFRAWAAKLQEARVPDQHMRVLDAVEHAIESDPATTSIMLGRLYPATVKILIAAGFSVTAIPEDPARGTAARTLLCWRK